MILKEGWITPGASLATTRPPTLISSQLAWPTAAPASASRVQWARTGRATLRTAVRPPTVTRTWSPKCWCARVCLKRRGTSLLTTTSEEVSVMTERFHLTDAKLLRHHINLSTLSMLPLYQHLYSRFLSVSLVLYKIFKILYFLFWLTVLREPKSIWLFLFSVAVSRCGSTVTMLECLVGFSLIV